jgi:hypothetical protein
MLSYIYIPLHIIYNKEAMIYEIRRYDLYQHNKKAFYERFEKFFVPISKKYGFKIVGAWDTVIGDVPETTYILAWANLNTRQDAWAKIDADPDWVKAKKDSQAEHGPLVLKTHSQILSPTSYSPLQ